jgi:hypothetical protein
MLFIFYYEIWVRIVSDVNIRVLLLLSFPSVPHDLPRVYRYHILMLLSFLSHLILYRLVSFPLSSSVYSYSVFSSLLSFRHIPPFYSTSFLIPFPSLHRCPHFYSMFTSLSSFLFRLFFIPIPSLIHSC